MQKCAQVLLTLDNLANRSQYINAKNTFEELLRWMGWAYHMHACDGPEYTGCKSLLVRW